MPTRIVVLAIIITAVCLPAFAEPVVYRSNFNLQIPAPNEPESKYGRGWMTDAIIYVPDHFTIYDLDVGINLTHSNVFDLQIFLQSPAGTRILLNKYDPLDVNEFPRGENYKNYRDTIFDDEAEFLIEDAKAPFTGRFRPKALDARNRLEVFDGQDTFGTWRLQIYDAWYDHTGELESFELIITVPEPATLFLLGAGLIYLRRQRRNLEIV